LIGDEWEYLQKLDFFAEIWDYCWPKKEYINISAIPDDRFLETVVRELRTFHTFYLTHFVPRNMTYSPEFGILIKVTGVCAACGGTVTFVTTRKMLGIQTFCGDCFRRVVFNPYELPEFNGHFRHLCAELQKAKRLAIIGTSSEALHMLKYDYFTLNYRSLAAFVEMDGKPSGFSEFYHLPRIRIEGLQNIQPDAILIADDLFGDAEFKIIKFYLKKNLPLPRILHLSPDSKRPLRGLLRFVRRHAAATFWNKCLVLPVIQIPITVAENKAWFLSMLRSRLDQMNRNEFFRTLLEKLRR
jgi:hypothetical protein